MSVINGTPGADLLNGTALGDQINGGDGDDVIRGFGGADTVNGGAGADRFVWNAGEGSDKVEGGADADTEFFAADGFVVSASAGHALVKNLAETVDLHGVETLNMHGVAPGASFTVGDLSATDVRQVVLGLDAGANTVALNGAATGDVFEVQVLSGGTLRVFDVVGGVVQTIVASKLDAADLVTIDAGAGNDVITVETPLGVVSPAPITAHGGAGNDTVTGSTGDDRLFGDAGDDVIASGGGADSIDGGAGLDTLSITGDGDGGPVTLAAVGGHLRQTVGGATTDVVNVETISLRPTGQTDTINLGDLSSAGVKTINLDLSGSAPGQADKVFLSPQAADVDLSFASAADGSSVQALYTRQGAIIQTVNVTGLGAADAVAQAGGAGDDVFSTTAFSSHVRIAVDGGAGANSQVFTGTAGSDAITLTANGTQAELTLNGSAALVMDNVQTVVIQAREGADTVSVGNLAGTDVTHVVVGLGNADGAPDGQTDVVTVNYALTGTNQLVGDFSATANSLQLSIPGVRVTDVTNFEAQDRVVVNLSGADSSNTYNLRGDFGHTEFQLGAKDDTVEWTLSKGQHDHNTINGGAGADTLEIGFDGDVRRFDTTGWLTSVNNNAGHTQLSMTHSPVGAPQDAVGVAVEVLNFEAVNVFGGAGPDIIVVADQTGTGLKFLHINVGGAGPDEIADAVFIDGTSGGDSMTAAVAGEAGELKITGLSEQIDILSLRSGDHFSQDHVFIRAGAGDDFLDFTNHDTGRGLVDLDGGAGNDTMIGGAGAEQFSLKVGGGHDVIMKFHAHALGGEADTVLVEGYTSFADLVAQGNIFQSGQDVVLVEGDGSMLTLVNTILTGPGALTAADFLFG